MASSVVPARAEAPLGVNRAGGRLASARLQCLELGCGVSVVLIECSFRVREGSTIAGIITGTGIIVLNVMIAATWYNPAVMPDHARPCPPNSMVLLTRLAKQVYRRSSEELLGMHMRLLMALSYVRDHDNTPQQELAEALCMDANNVVLLLNELEDLGYVARRRDPHDRRRHLVELTDEGSKR